MSVAINLPLASGEAYRGAPYDLAVKRGCLAFHVFGGDLDQSLMNHAPGRAQAAAYGTFAAGHIGAAHVEFVSGSRMFMLPVPDQPCDLFFIAQTSDTLADEAHRPVFAGTASGITGVTRLELGGKWLRPHATSLRMQAVATTNNAGARADVIATVPAPEGDYGWASYALIEAQFRTDRIYLRDHTRQLESTTPVTRAFAPDTRQWLIGGCYSPTTSGVNRQMMANLYLPGMTADERAAHIAQMRKLALLRGGVTV